MTVSSSTNRVSYSGNGSLTVFAYTFKVFDEDDLTVILRASDGTETTQTITTHYTVSGVGDAGGGNVTFITAPSATETVVILREQPLTQELDLVPNDPFPAQSLEESLDKLVFMVQAHEEELGRAIKASKTNVISGSEFTISATDRANKVFAFDSSGDVSITQEIGVYRGNWAASTAYSQRDIVKDTSNNNIYICNTAHTSSGTTPISSNADTAKWYLLVDAASATSAQTAAEAAQTAAETAQTAAETAQTGAETAQTAAETAQTAAETAQTGAETAETNAETAQTAAEAAQAAAELAYDNFDDRYLGAKSTTGGDPTLDNDGNALIDGALFFDTTNNVMKVYNLGTTTWLRTTPTSADQTNIDTVSGISADISTVAGDTTNIGTIATDLNGSNNIGTVAGSISNVNLVGGSITDVSTVASNLTDVQSFANTYRIGATDPTTSLDTGDLFYNTTSSVLKIYNGSAWESGVTAGSGFMPTTGGAFTGDVTWGDNNKAIFGAGSDLQIYHNGSDSFIDDAGTGNLNIRGSSIVQIGKYTGEVAAQFVADGEVNLRYNNSEKLATTPTGIDVTGEMIADSYNETYAAVTSTTNATTVNCEAGNAFSHTLTENTTFTFSNPPASGTAYSMSIEIIQDASASGFTVTWPTSVDWPAATAPTLTATASAKDVFVFYTRDGGTTWLGFTAGQALG